MAPRGAIVALATLERAGQSAVAARRHLLSAGAVDVACRPSASGSHTVFRGSFEDELVAHETVRELRDAGWAAIFHPGEASPFLPQWRKNTRAHSFGDAGGRQLSIAFPWSELGCGDEGSSLIEVDSGGSARLGWAFGGVGNHPTTCLVLRTLLQRLSSGESVLDLGCGNGVLAVAAATIGAECVAVDIREASRVATERNAQRNGVERLVRYREGELHTLGRQFDAVLANIHREALIELAPQISAVTAPGGWVAMSGFSPTQLWMVAGAFRELGLELEEEQHHEDGWGFSGVVLRKPG